ncbi:MAG: DUF4386 domain-containing protein [Gammaproteobacteria bacterium]|nr:DUF4386 domain-containing protein [Gammaproteobacteria bacterium]
MSSFFLFLGHVVTDSTLGHGRASVVFFLLYGFPVSLAGLALYMTFRKHDPTLAMFGGFGFASHGLFVVLTATLLLVGLRFPQEFATFGAESGPVAGIASSLELTMDKIGKSAFVFLGLGLLPVGVLILRTGAVARWIGWLGSAAGVLEFFGFLAGLAGILVGRAAEVVIPIAMLPSFAFMLILGFRLISREVGGRDRGTLHGAERLVAIRGRSTISKDNNAKVCATMKLVPM